MKPYRQNVHIAPLIVWAILCVGVSIFLFNHSRHILDRHWHDNEVAAGAALLVFGPVALVLYILRSRLMWIAVVPEGVSIGGRRVIPWSAIEVVERRKPMLRKQAGPAQAPESKGLSALGNGCGNPGCGYGGGEIGGLILAVAIIGLALLAFWLIFFVFVPLVVVPILEIFTPLGDRIRIVAGPHSVLLRDLRNADEFLAELGSRATVKEL